MSSDNSPPGDPSRATVAKLLLLKKGVANDSGERQSKSMENQSKPPTKLTDFKGKPPRVRTTKHPKDEADVAATKVLMDLYTKDDGFHCPKCGVVITDGDKAVAHLAEEINKALEQICR